MGGQYFNYPRNKKKLDPELAMELYDEGLNDPQIAEEMGVSKGTVFNWRKSIGLDPHCKANGKKPQSHSNPSKDAFEAHKLGMTYGQYKATQRTAAALV